MPDDLTRQREAVARRLREMHYDGTRCGDSQSPGACSNCFGPSPMTADEIARVAVDTLAALAPVQPHEHTLRIVEGASIACCMSCCETVEVQP